MAFFNLISPYLPTKPSTVADSTSTHSQPHSITHSQTGLVYTIGHGATVSEVSTTNTTIACLTLYLVS